MERDLAGALKLLTPMGPLALPVRALARRALPAVAGMTEGGSVLEVGGRGGGVMVAASAERLVTITNAGALDVAYDIQARHLQGPVARDGQPLPEGGATPPSALQG